MLEETLKLEVFKLKGRLYTFTVLELLNTDSKEFKAALETIYQQAPKMFSHTPVVLDLSALQGASFDIKGLCELMRDTKLVPVAVQGASVIQQKAAVAAGLSVLSSNSKKDIEVSLAKVQQAQVAEDKAPTATLAEKPSTAAGSNSNQSKLITTPVRSGQQIYAKEADLIVLSSVGRGAELLADGNIHVYGSLRGRALAGLNGNTEARIFCSQLDAELIAIAGHYLMPENFPENKVDGARQVFFKDGHLQIVRL